MTDADHIDPLDAEADRILAEALSSRRRSLALQDKARGDQPERLKRARVEAEEARMQSMLIEPWDAEVKALPAHAIGGDPTGQDLLLPNSIAKMVFGMRLAFDVLDCADDDTGERLNEVRNRMFVMVGGDTGLAMLLMSAALETIVTLVMPLMLDELEGHGNWDARVILAETRTKAWRDRLAEYRGRPDASA